MSAVENGCLFNTKKYKLSISDVNNINKDIRNKQTVMYLVTKKDVGGKSTKGMIFEAGRMSNEVVIFKGCNILCSTVVAIFEVYSAVSCLSSQS